MPDTPTDLDWIRAAPEDEAGPGPWIEVAFGAEDLVHLRETSDPENVVTTTRTKWDAFVLGVQAGEFDHFAETEPESAVSDASAASAASAVANNVDVLADVHLGERRRRGR